MIIHSRDCYTHGYIVCLFNGLITVAENLLLLEQRWQHHREPALLAASGGAIDTISFITLFGLFTAHVTGNLVVAGAAWPLTAKVFYPNCLPFLFLCWRWRSLRWLSNVEKLSRHASLAACSSSRSCCYCFSACWGCCGSPLSARIARPR